MHTESSTPTLVAHFSLPGLPKTTNSIGRMHFSFKMKEAKLWRNRTAAHVINSVEKPLKTATLILTRHSSREPDFDGLVSSFKHIIDGLVEGGLLADDKSSNIGQPTYKWVKCGTKKGHIEVQIFSTEKGP